jgi:hypothetical protein
VDKPVDPSIQVVINQSISCRKNDWQLAFQVANRKSYLQNPFFLIKSKSRSIINIKQQQQHQTTTSTTDLMKRKSPQDFGHFQTEVGARQKLLLISG